MELKSSNLASADYEPDTMELVVTFRSGASYAYSGVDQIVYDDLLAANSPGSYFAKWIKGRYPDRRLP